MDIYKHPKYYDVAFSYRDIPAEVDFIEDVIRRFSRIPVLRFLELASGTSPHMAELCHRGYEYVGVDLSAEMIAWSRERISRAGLPAEVIRADMRDFRLSDAVDCVLLFLGSLYVRTDKELQIHLRSVAQALSPGGLYILDGVVRVDREQEEKQTWVQSRGDISVDVTWDPRNGEDVLALLANDGGNREFIQHTEVKKRYALDDFVSQVENSGDWDCVHSCSAWDLQRDIHSGGRSLIILRRQSH